MRLQILLLLFVNVFRPLSCSEQPDHQVTNEKEAVQNATTVTAEETTAKEVVVAVRNSLYPHRVGIQNPKFNCYMNSLFSCLYNIPFYQNSVYRAVDEIPAEEFPQTSKSTLLSLADIFVRMRLGGKPINIKPTMFPAIKSAFNWEVGHYQCVLELWEYFVETMPESFREVSKVQLNLTHHRKSDSKIIKSVLSDHCYVEVPVPESKVSLSSIIDQEFINFEAEDFVLYPEDQSQYGHLLDGPINEKVPVSAYTTITFANTPNVIIFGMKRLGWDQKKQQEKLNETTIVLDPITIKGEVYQPCAFVLFRNDISHYYALIKDFRVSDIFIHNDTNVSLINITTNDANRAEVSKLMFQNSTMVFYVKVSALTELKESGDVAKILSDKDISAILKQKLQEEALEKELKKQTKASHANKKKRRNAVLNDYKQRKKLRKSKSKTQFAESPKYTINSAEDAEDNGENEESRDNDPETVESDVDAEAQSIENADSLDPLAEEDDDMISISSDAILNNYDEIEPKVVDKVNESEGISKENDNNAVSAPVDNSLPANEFEFDDELFDAAIQHVNDIMSQEKAVSIDPLQHVYDHGYTGANKNNASLPVQEPEQQQQSTIQEPATSAVFQGAVVQQYRNLAATQIQVPSNISSFNDQQQYVAPTTTQQQYVSPTFVQQQYVPPAAVLQQNVAQPSQQRAQVEYQKLSFDQLPPAEQEMVRNICATHRLKFLDKAYQLGTENYSFASDSACHALEMILTGLASNPAFLLGLLEIIKTKSKDLTIFETNLAVVLIQMLIGCKDINTFVVLTPIEKEHKVKLSDRHTSTSLPDKITTILHYLCRKFGNSLISHPNVKNILYSELDTDEPLQINHYKSQLIAVNPSSTIPVRPGNFNGVILDRAQKDGNRLRSVLSSTSDSLMFPIVTPRTTLSGKFIADHLKPSSLDHVFIGCIKYGPIDNVYDFSADFVGNHFPHVMFSYDSTNGARINKYNPNDFSQILNYTNLNVLSRAYVSFVIKKSDTLIKPISATQIPMEIAQQVVKKIQMDAFAVTPTVLRLRAETSGTGDHNRSAVSPVADGFNPSFTASPLTANLFPRYPNGQLRFQSSPPQETININGVHYQLPQAPKSSNTNSNSRSSKNNTNTMTKK